MNTVVPWLIANFMGRKLINFYSDLAIAAHVRKRKHTG
jgi:hypothetical protein